MGLIIAFVIYYGMSLILKEKDSKLRNISTYCIMNSDKGLKAVKEENTVTKILDDEVEFDGKRINKIRFDLEHINRGWDKNKNDYNPTRRSHYEEDDVIEFFEQLGFYSIEWDGGPEGNKIREVIKGKVHFRYIAIITDHNCRELKKMIIDLPEDFENVGIVVTIY
jgi:hypothetical protein